MGRLGGFSRMMLAVAGLALAVPAAAQFSDSYNFLKAVRETDGTKAMEYLSKPGAPMLNTRDRNTGETALHIVTKRHDLTWLNFLLSKGANTELADNDGNTPLHVAAQISDPEAARALLSYDAKINARNNSGETPLILAVHRRDVPTIRLLLSAGADPSISDTLTGKSAVAYAEEDARGTAIVKLLAEAKPKPTVKIGPTR